MSKKQPVPIKEQEARFLRGKIYGFIQMHNIAVDEFKHPAGSIVSDGRRLNQMADSLTNEVIELILKYFKGQLEHGGDICDRDLTKELTQERRDIFWYSEADKWKKGYAVGHYDDTKDVAIRAVEDGRKFKQDDNDNTPNG